MQGDPFDHLMAGIGVDAYVAAARSSRETFFVLTAAAKPDLNGLAFRTGYAPFPPFTGELIGPPGAWAQRNRDRLPVLLQPLGLWSGAGEADDDGGGQQAHVAAPPAAFVNRSLVAVPYQRIDAGLPMLATHMHWIDRRRAGQPSACRGG